MSVAATEAEAPVAAEPALRRPRRAHRGGIALDLAILVAFAVAVVGLYVWRKGGFFLIDDAQNEFLPYLTEMGRQWLSGHVPVMTSDTIFGGNYFIALERAVFSPQIVVFSIIAALVPNHLLVATAFAGASILLAAIGGWLIGRVLQLGRVYSLLLGGTVATVPVFLFMYTASWWNGAAGSVALVFAIAALLRAIRVPSLGSSLLLGLATLVVLVSGWPHALIGLLAVGACLLVATAVVPEGWRNVLRDGAWKRLLVSWLPVLVPMAVAAIVSVPVYAEFVIQGKLLFRFNQISNEGAFCVPGLDQALAVMNPVASTYWNCWGGYTNWPFPIGFVSILATLALVFHVPRRGDRIAGGLIASALVLFLLTQLPSVFLSTRYPFRFLPILGVVLAVLLFHLLRHGIRRVTRTRVVVALLLTAAAAYVGVTHDVDPGWGDAVEAVVFVALTVAGIAVLLRRWERFRPAVFSLLALAGVVLVALQGQGLGTRYLYDDRPQSEVNLSAEQREQIDAGFVAVAQMPNDISSSAGSARSLLLGWRSFNGYDPVGQRAFMERFGNHAPQGFYDAGLVTALGEPAQVGADGVCDFEVYGVRSVIAQADLDGEGISALERCGFTLESTVGNSSFWVSSAKPVGATLSYADPGIEYADDVNADQRHESAEITANSNGGDVVFARLWWPGYTATLDGEPVPVTAYDGILAAVELPAGATGTLELSYTPTSWRWAIPVSVLGVLLGAGALIWGYARRRKEARRPS
ncbi:hypothetical protein [Naasia sp. SYSU D00057]|uniref:hypothetical protein n=1 Tax=Naasia sp. SYSU D00057 TaxID=2817380 RepID=UPI001B315115|nr:hypothetical protein [Naasia sp. SYSU D00057]